MRFPVFAAVPALAAFGLAACSTATGPGAYEADLKQIQERCEARGGVLTPTGQTTGRPQTEYACQITGQPSGRVQR